MPPYTRSIYLLSPRQLSPETIAVAFAKTSRSPESFAEIAQQLTEEKSAEFHEKWVVGYGHACYDDQTDVLTDQGWRNWSQIAQDWNKGEASFRLATLNPATGLIEYNSPLRIIAEPYHGPMYRVAAKAVDLFVTPNHKMWVCTTRTQLGRKKKIYRLIAAHELEGIPCVYQLSARWKGPEPARIMMGQHEVAACALMQLTGFFIGDGHHDPRYHNAVFFHLRKEREIAFLQQTVAECEFEVRQHGDGDKYYVIGSGLADFLGRCYDGQRRKIIPREILSYGPMLLSSLMDGLLHSDGSVDKHNHALYNTTSEPLKDQIYELALKLGWVAYATKHEEDRIERKKLTPTYIVHFNRTRLKPEVNKVSHRKQDGWESYAGIVYCAEMSCNHILYVRRSGRPVWSGNSVAEHAVLHIALENVSRLAIECLESNRLASYTEKSTRYQQWAPDSFYLPPEVPAPEGNKRGLAGPHEALYRETCELLFRAYHDSLAPVRAVVQGQYPRHEGESEARRDGRIRSKYVDACRFLLPAAALANVGMTANARTLEHAIRKMLSHPLAEVREIGQAVKEVARAEVPTLLKYAEHNPYMAETGAALAALARPLGPPIPGEGIPHPGPPPIPGEGDGPLTLIHYDPTAEERALAAALYRFAGCDFETALARVRTASPEERRELAAECLSRLDRFDAPLRELEHVTYTFEALMDQGAYFEVKRHRMMTQTPQRLTADLGYAVPRLIEAAGFRPRYEEAMAHAGEAWAALAAHDPESAAYLVPNGYNRRLLMTLNLREAFHFCELRAAPNAHFSVRRVAARMAEIIRAVHPTLSAFMRLPQGLDWRAIEAEHFARC